MLHCGTCAYLFLPDKRFFFFYPNQLLWISCIRWYYFTKWSSINHDTSVDLRVNRQLSTYVVVLLNLCTHWIKIFRMKNPVYFRRNGLKLKWNNYHIFAILFKSFQQNFSWKIFIYIQIHKTKMMFLWPVYLWLQHLPTGYLWERKICQIYSHYSYFKMTFCLNTEFDTITKSYSHREKLKFFCFLSLKTLQIQFYIS